MPRLLAGRLGFGSPFPERVGVCFGFYWLPGDSGGGGKLFNMGVRFPGFSWDLSLLEGNLRY